MFEPVTKSSPYFQPIFSQIRVVNKAFSSLSFRGKKGYSSNLIIKEQKVKEVIKQKTYGAIICIKDKLSNNDLYALVQGSYTGKWSFPKGHSNEGEKPFECTMREVGEETGIDKLPEPSEYVQVGYGNYFVFYLEEPVPLIPRDTHEIMDTKWVTLEEMKRMSLNADASQYVSKILVTKILKSVM